LDPCLTFWDFGKEEKREEKRVTGMKKKENL
jgi:hypothetical protein